MNIFSLAHILIDIFDKIYNIIVGTFDFIDISERKKTETCLQDKLSHQIDNALELHPFHCRFTISIST